MLTTTESKQGKRGNKPRYRTSTCVLSTQAVTAWLVCRLVVHIVLWQCVLHWLPLQPLAHWRPVWSMDLIVTVTHSDSEPLTVTDTHCLSVCDNEW